MNIHTVPLIPSPGQLSGRDTQAIEGDGKSPWSTAFPEPEPDPA